MLELGIPVGLRKEESRRCWFADPVATEGGLQAGTIPETVVDGRMEANAGEFCGCDDGGGGGCSSGTAVDCTVPVLGALYSKKQKCQSSHP